MRQLASVLAILILALLAMNLFAVAPGEARVAQGSIPALPIRESKLNAPPLQGGSHDAPMAHLLTPTPTPTAILTKETGFPPPDDPAGLPSRTPVPTTGLGARIYCKSPNLAIPDNNPTGVADPINLAIPGTVGELRLHITATHSFVGDLVFQLRHSSGVSATVIDRPGYPATPFGCSGDNIDAFLEDGARSPVETTCAATVPTLSGSLSPNQPLAAFHGRALAGTWQLVVSDHALQDTGILQEWCLIEQEIPPTATPTPTSPPARSGIHLPFIVMLAPSPTLTPIPPPCLTYEIEPNNVRAEANSRPPFCIGTTIYGQLPPDDNDLFRMEVGSGYPPATLRLTDIPEGSDYDLYLYDANLNSIASSVNPGDINEQITRTLSLGTYYLRVFRRQGGSLNFYSLSWNH